MTTTPTCAERLPAEFDGRIQDLHELWTRYCAGEEEEEIDTATATTTNDLGSIFDYGLSFDWIAPNTFRDQQEGYYRYQLSCGGPQDEFRFFPKHWRIEYWFLDWFDGAYVELVGDDKDLLIEIYEWFESMGMTEVKT